MIDQYLHWTKTECQERKRALNIHMKLRKVNEKRKIVRKKKKENVSKIERNKEKFRNIGSTNDCP